MVKELRELTHQCNTECLRDATTPLKRWEDVFQLPNPNRAILMRLLLSEIGWRLIGTANWQTEGKALLWTAENRVRWERARVAGDETKMSRFKLCDLGFYNCVIVSKQYYGMSQHRARDPLYLDYFNPKDWQRRYFHDIKFVPVALDRAYQLVTSFIAGAPDPTNIDGKGGAHFMAHEGPVAVFRRRVDVFCGDRFVESIKEKVLEIPYLELIPDLP